MEIRAGHTFVLFILAVVMAFSSNASQSALNSYNLILIEDYNFKGGDVQGRTLVGGDLNARSDGGHLLSTDFGSRLANTDTAIDAVTVVGDVYGDNFKVLKDNNFVYGGNLNGTNIELNDGDDGQLIFNPNLDISDIVSQLYADTAYYANLAANASSVRPQHSNDRLLTYTGSDNTAVFNVDAADIFAQNSTVKLNQGSADFVVINVAGKNIDISQGGVNLTEGFNEQTFSNIIWNFYEADRIDFGSLAVKGSVLAPYAHTFGSANVDGAYAALSFTGAREFHNFTFDGPTPPVTQVPGPASILILALGVALMWRKRR